MVNVVLAVVVLAPVVLADSVLSFFKSVKT